MKLEFQYITEGETLIWHYLKSSVELNLGRKPLDSYRLLCMYVDRYHFYIYM